MSICRVFDTAMRAMLDDAAAQQIALRHYRTKWFGQAWGAIAAAWQTEYDSVAAGTFNSMEVFSAASEGFNTAARENFEQGARISGLQQFRGELDADYAVAVFAPRLGR
jgi:hypothetical protein